MLSRSKLKFQKDPTTGWWEALDSGRHVAYVTKNSGGAWQVKFPDETCWHTAESSDTRQKAIDRFRELPTSRFTGFERENTAKEVVTRFTFAQLKKYAEAEDRSGIRACREWSTWDWDAAIKLLDEDVRKFVLEAIE